MHARLAALSLAALMVTGCQSAGQAPPTAAPTPTVTATVTPAVPPSAAPPATATETETETEAAVLRPANPQDLVLKFVQAIADGDGRTSYGMLTPAAQEGAGGRDGWDDRLPDYTAGVGAYTAAGDLVAREVPLDEADSTVVELLATVTREGVTEFDVAAFLVREIDGGESGIDLLQDYDPIEFVSVWPEIVVRHPDDMLMLTLLVDGQVVEADRVVPAPRTPGEHTVTAVAYPAGADQGGYVDAATAVYTVPG